MRQKYIRGFRLSLSTLACLAALTFQGCGAPANSSRPSSLSKDAQPKWAALVFGGNASCHPFGNDASSPYGLSMYTQFDEVVRDLRSQYAADVDYFLICHTVTGRIYYASSAAPKIVSEVAPERLAKKVTEFTQTHGVQRLHAVGHSHGGWWALKLALQLADQIHFDRLVTIDPISRVTCRPPNIMGCLGAPRDISESEYQQIAESVGKWSNYYQSRTPYLHSSAIPGASENIELPIDHLKIDNSAEVWRQIRESAIIAVKERNI